MPTWPLPSEDSDPLEQLWKQSSWQQGWPNEGGFEKGWTDPAAAVAAQFWNENVGFLVFCSPFCFKLVFQF